MRVCFCILFADWIDGGICLFRFRICVCDVVSVCVGARVRVCECERVWVLVCCVELFFACFEKPMCSNRSAPVRMNAFTKFCWHGIHFGFRYSLLHCSHSYLPFLFQSNNIAIAFLLFPYLLSLSLFLSFYYLLRCLFVESNILLNYIQIAKISAVPSNKLCQNIELN